MTHPCHLFLYWSGCFSSLIRVWNPNSPKTMSLFLLGYVWMESFEEKKEEKESKLLFFELRELWYLIEWTMLQNTFSDVLFLTLPYWVKCMWVSIILLVFHLLCGGIYYQSGEFYINFNQYERVLLALFLI